MNGRSHSRRDFGRMVLAGATLAATSTPASAGPPQRPASTVRGVRLGLITGSLGSLTAPASGDVIDVVIEQSLEVGAGWIELVNTLVEPQLQGGGIGWQVPASATPAYEASRAALREWRLTTPLTRFEQIRQKFEASGLELFSYVITISDDFTDDEIDAVFRQMQALGVRVFSTNQTRVATGMRLGPFADRYGISPAFHTHANVVDPNEVASVDSLQRLLAASPRFLVNLDIGHFTAGNNDAVAFIREHHDRISHLHVKDRRRNGGPSVDWGTGDTPIGSCLKVIRDNQYPIVCIVERDNRDVPFAPADATRRYLEYMRRVLAA